MHLATGVPAAEWSGEHIILSVPSGNATVEVAITPAHGQRLARSILDASAEAFEERSKPLPRAEILDMATGRKKRTR